MVNPAPATGDPAKAAVTHVTNNSKNGAGSAQEAAADDDPDNQPWPVTTWQGWQHFATTPPPAPPQQPGAPPRTAEQRLAYHSAFVTLRTPAIDTLTTQVRTQMVLGRHQQHTARPIAVSAISPAPRTLRFRSQVSSRRPPMRRSTGR